MIFFAAFWALVAVMGGAILIAGPHNWAAVGCVLLGVGLVLLGFAWGLSILYSDIELLALRQEKAIGDTTLSVTRQEKAILEMRVWLAETENRKLESKIGNIAK